MQQTETEVGTTGNKQTLAAYTFAHFCVDFCCIYLCFWLFAPQVARSAWVSVGFLTYNVLAFGLQPIFGFLSDKAPTFPTAPVGCALVLAALFLPFYPWPALVLAAVGNALFHVGGGIDSLAGSCGKMARSGVFVSSGALGVPLGAMAGGWGPDFMWLPATLAACALLVCLWARFFTRQLKTKVAYFATENRGPVGLVLALCVLSIVIRAWAGGMLPLPWKDTVLYGLLPGLCAMLGKASGGYLADRFGARTVGAISLAASIPFLWFAPISPLPAAAGILLFNMNMPVTLCTVSSLLPHNPGLSFGLTTLALLVGTLPLFLFALPQGWVLPAIALSTLGSAICLWMATRNQPKSIIQPKRN